MRSWEHQSGLFKIGLGRSRLDKTLEKLRKEEEQSQKLQVKSKKTILRKAREHPEKASTRKLGAELKLSKTTIHEVYREKGLIYGKLGKRPDLSLETKEDRMTFCQDMLEENGQRIYETFFSDEMGIKLSDAQLDKRWYKPQKKLKMENLPINIKVNCWGAILKQGFNTSSYLQGQPDGICVSYYS
jgi:methylphosphotriester-DNA--protein-cysteine methyltransferase